MRERFARHWKYSTGSYFRSARIADARSNLDVRIQRLSTNRKGNQRSAAGDGVEDPRSSRFLGRLSVAAEGGEAASGRQLVRIVQDFLQVADLDAPLSGLAKPLACLGQLVVADAF